MASRVFFSGPRVLLFGIAGVQPLRLVRPRPVLHVALVLQYFFPEINKCSTFSKVLFITSGLWVMFPAETAMVQMISLD